MGYIYELLTRIGLEGVLRDPWLTEDVQTAPALEVGPELTLTDQETLNLVTQTQLKLGLNNLKLEKILEYIRWTNHILYCHENFSLKLIR